MRWERFFDDLEDQLAAEWEAERAALESEAERVRVAREDLRTRLVAIARDAEAPVVLELADGSAVEVELATVGADWVAASERGGARRLVLAPIAALRGLRAAGADLRRSARPSSDRGDLLAERVTFALALRDLARRRVGVAIGVDAGAGRTRVLAGTLDRVAADHADLAEHDAGAPRRAAEVRGHRLLPLSAIAWVRIEAAVGVPVV